MYLKALILPPCYSFPLFTSPCSPPSSSLTTLLSSVFYLLPFLLSIMFFFFSSFVPFIRVFLHSWQLFSIVFLYFTDYFLHFIFFYYLSSISLPPSHPSIIPSLPLFILSLCQSSLCPSLITSTITLSPILFVSPYASSLPFPPSHS